MRIGKGMAVGGLSPEGKLALIKRLQEGGGEGEGGGGKKGRAVVCMVGDGINDAAALSGSDLGVAMGGGSTEVAMECADVVIRGENLEDLGVFFALAGRVRRHIWVNFCWAGLYTCVTMPLAAGVLYTATHTVVIPPGFSGLSEMVSSVPVVLGSLLVYRFKRGGGGR